MIRLDEPGIERCLIIQILAIFKERHWKSLVQGEEPPAPLVEQRVLFVDQWFEIVVLACIR